MFLCSGCVQKSPRGPWPGPLRQLLQRRGPHLDGHAQVLPQSGHRHPGALRPLGDQRASVLQLLRRLLQARQLREDTARDPDKVRLNSVAFPNVLFFSKYCNPSNLVQNQEVAIKGPAMNTCFGTLRD